MRAKYKREVSYRSSRSWGWGENPRPEEETVESTLCRHPLYRSVVLPPHPAQRAAVLQSVKGARGGGEEGRREEGEGGTALSLRVQVEKAGGETHYCSSLTVPQHFARAKLPHNTHIRERETERDRDRDREKERERERARFKLV